MEIKKIEVQKIGMVSDTWDVCAGELDGDYIAMIHIGFEHPWFDWNMKEVNKDLKGHTIDTNMSMTHSYLMERSMNLPDASPEDYTYKHWIGCGFEGDTDIRSAVENQAGEYLRKLSKLALNAQLAQNNANPTEGSMQKEYEKSLIDADPMLQRKYPEDDFTAKAVHEMMDENPQMFLASSDGDMTLHYMQKSIVLLHSLLRYRSSMSQELAGTYEELILRTYIDRKQYIADNT